MKTKADLSPLILNWSQRFKNRNDINPRSSDASVNMYDFDSYFDDLSSDVTSAVRNVEKTNFKIENARKSSWSTMT